MKTIKKIFKWIGLFLLLFLCYVIGSILYGTVTEYKPADTISLEIEQTNSNTVVNDSILTAVLWNVGYGGLGAESNFFLDNGGFYRSNGDMVRASETMVNKNIDGALSFLSANDSVDFILLQEVDANSRRSYYINQYEKYQETLPGHSSTFALNFNVKRVPIPMLEPWNVIGKAYSGLGTFSKYTPKSVDRFQLPGEYGWPDRIFHLDRCAAVHRIPHESGKEVIIVNIHNSAYDKGGLLKKQQMEFLKKFFLEEHAKGNYLIIGGDWNQCPPGFAFDKFSKSEGDAIGYSQINVTEDYLPEGWKYVYDTNVATNRKLNFPYEKGKSFTTLIDFFLVSPNVEVLESKGVDQNFQYSDHQPVWMKIKLK